MPKTTPTPRVPTFPPADCTEPSPKTLTVYIYALVDPRTDQIRYVGKTSDRPSNRLSSHCKDLRNVTHKTHWISALIRDGFRPQMIILETIENSNDADWQEVERFWIAYLKFLGFRLTNLDSGGRGGTMKSEETRKKLSISHLGKLKGIPRSPEVRAKISIAQKGKPRPVTPEHRHKLIQSLAVGRDSDESREKHRKAMEQRVYSAQHRERLSRAHIIYQNRKRWQRKFDRAGVTGKEPFSELLNNPKFLIELIYSK